MCERQGPGEQGPGEQGPGDEQYGSGASATLPRKLLARRSVEALTKATESNGFGLEPEYLVTAGIKLAEHAAKLWSPMDLDLSLSTWLPLG